MISLLPTRRRRRHDSIEILEARVAPATLVSVNTSTHALTVQGDYADDGSSTVQANAAESLFFSVSGGNLVIQDSIHGVTAAGGGVVQSGSHAVTIALTALTGNISIDTGGGADSLTFNGALAAAANKNLIVDTAGTISITPTGALSTTGTGHLLLETDRDISIAGGATVSVVNGNLDLIAHGTVSGNYSGISLGGGTVSSSGSGAITLDGTGGDTGLNNHGLNLFGQISASSGPLLLMGQGGAGSDANSGIVVTNGSINSGMGDLTFVGTPGGDAGSSYGINLGITTSSAGNVHFVADKGILFAAGAHVSATTGTVDIHPATPGIAISLGTASQAAFGVSDAMISAVDAITVVIGNAQAGAITHNGNISASKSLDLKTSSTLTGVSASLAVAAGKNLSVEAGGQIQLGGAITVPGLLSLAGVGGDIGISLINSANDLNNVHVAHGASVALRDANGFSFDAEASTLLSLASAGTITQQGSITGGGDLLKLGSGTLQLTLANLVGDTTISEGTVQFGNFGAFGSGTIVLGDSSTGSSPVALLATIPISAGTFINPIVAPDLAGGGPVTIGTVNGPSAGAFFSGPMTLDRATTLQAGASVGTFFAGVISGNVGLLTIDGGSRVTFGGVNNTFNGDVQIIGNSKLELLPGGNSIPDSSNVFVEAGSVFRLSKSTDATETINNLTGAGIVTTGLNEVKPQILTITAGAAGSQFDGFITNGGAPLSLTKIGSGIAVFTNVLTYSGTTTIQDGTLRLVNASVDNPIRNSTMIDIHSGATLDVLGLNHVGDPQTLALTSSQTLIGNGTIFGSLSGFGKVAPGTAAAPGTLTINGSFSPHGEVLFRVNSPYTSPGTDFDQIVIASNGQLDMSAAKLRLLGGDVALASGTTLTLIANNGPSATVAGTSPVEGGLIGVGIATFAVNYNAGNGSDVVLTASAGLTSLSANLTAGKLTIGDTAARPHRLSYSVAGQNILISDLVEFFTAAPAGAQLVDNGHSLSIPASLVKAVQINGGVSDDSLTIDLDTLLTKKLPTGGLVFDGGAQATSLGDQIALFGDQGDVIYTYTSATAGSIALSKLGKVTLTALESVVNNGSAHSQIFDLPAGENHVALGDDGVAGNGLTRLSGSTFPVTDFAAPTAPSATGGVFLNPGGTGNTLNVLALPDFDDNLLAGSATKRFDNVTFATSADFTGTLKLETNTLGLASNLHLSATGGNLGVAGGMINGMLSGGFGITKTAATASGTALILTAANTYTGETVVTDGSLTLNDALAVQNSTVRISTGKEVHFRAAIGTFTFGGLAGTGALSLMDDGGSPVTLLTGKNDSTYSGALSGQGTLHKIGAGTLTLTGTNTHNGTFLEDGILQIRSDLNLGQTGIALIGDGGTLQAQISTKVTRNIVLQGDTTFQAALRQTLTLSGVISGTGDLEIGDIGTVLVTGLNNTNTGEVELGGGVWQMVNGVAISTPGIKNGIKVSPGATPNELGVIDLTAVSVPISLNIKSPKTGTVTIDQIISTDATAVKKISLGAHVMLGNGVADSTPDLILDGKLTSLIAGDVSPNAIIQIGKDLAYLDTYKNKPNITLGNVGDGVVIDATGNGMPAGPGGGGIGSLVVNSWSGNGIVKVSQSITSFVVKTGNFTGTLQVDPGHLGAATVANIGKISIPNGSWGGAGLQVEGIVSQFLTKGIIDGANITAGAFGTVTINGNFDGSIIAKADASVTVPVLNKAPKVIATGAIGNITIAGDFGGIINADGHVGNITLSGTGRFTGTVRGASIGNITASSFTGTGAQMGDPRHTITAIGSIGNITAKTGGLTDYLIAAGTDLGSDALVGGVADSFHSFFLSTTNVKTAVSIGTVNIKGVVLGTTVAAGVDPGMDGIYGDGNDLLIALPLDVTKTKVKVGAMTFDANPISEFTFSNTAANAVTNAFEAQVLTSLKFGKGAASAANLQYRSVFTAPTYFDSGGSTIVVRLLA